MSVVNNVTVIIARVFRAAAVVEKDDVGTFCSKSAVHEKQINAKKYHCAIVRSLAVVVIPAPSSPPRVVAPNLASLKLGVLRVRDGSMVVVLGQ